MKCNKSLGMSGWEAGIRTPIRRSRVCSLTVRRPPNGDLHFIKRYEIVSTTTHRSTLKLAMRKLFQTSFSLALVAFGAGAVDWKTLKPEGYVSDFARVIDGGSRQQLEANLAKMFPGRFSKPGDPGKRPRVSC